MLFTNIVMQFAFLFAPLLHLHFVCEPVAPGLYRGLDPSCREIRVLKEKGIKTIVSVRTRPQPGKAKLCKKLGMRWVHIPTGVFSTPKSEQFEEFMNIVTNPANQPVFACCTIDMERSAAYVEAYRMKEQHWTSAQIYDEFTRHHLKRWWPPFHAYQGAIEDYCKGASCTAAKESGGGEQIKAAEKTSPEISSKDNEPLPAPTKEQGAAKNTNQMARPYITQ